MFTTLDTSIDERETISSANPLYLRINYARGYIEGKSGNKYFIFDSVDELCMNCKYATVPKN